MSSIPLPALQIRQQPSAMEQYGQAMQLKQLMQAQQMGQIQLQQAQQQQKDQQTVMEAFKNNNGDLDATIKEASQKGVTPATLMKLQAQSLDVKTKVAALSKDQLANYAQQQDNAAGLAEAVKNAPPEQKASVYEKGRQQILQNPSAYGVTDPSQVPPAGSTYPQGYPGDDLIEQQLAIHQGGKLQFDQEMKRREVAAQEQASKARETTAEAAVGKSGPLAPPQITQLNQTLQDRYQVLNPGQQLPPQYALQPGAKQTDYNTIDKALQQVEQAQSVKASQQNAQATRQVAQAAQANTRSDKSYQFNSGQLEKVAAPIDQAVSRLGRLNDALAQNTPQADALVAPELLSVMAGGAGSGLRMNEAEISRIVGGRSKWESLKAAVNQWSLDPSKANSITPDQRQQIRALTTEVNTKLTAKQQALDQARQDLLSTDDPGQHRKIVANARSKMTSVDQTPAQAASSGPPPGATHIVMGKDGQKHYTNATGTVDYGIAK